LKSLNDKNDKNFGISTENATSGIPLTFSSQKTAIAFSGAHSCQS